MKLDDKQREKIQEFLTQTFPSKIQVNCNNEDLSNFILLCLETDSTHQTFDKDFLKKELDHFFGNNTDSYVEDIWNFINEQIVPLANASDEGQLEDHILSHLEEDEEKSGKNEEEDQDNDEDDLENNLFQNSYDENESENEQDQDQHFKRKKHKDHSSSQLEFNKNQSRENKKSVQETKSFQNLNQNKMQYPMNPMQMAPNIMNQMTNKAMMKGNNQMPMMYQFPPMMNPYFMNMQQMAQFQNQMQFPFMPQMLRDQQQMQFGNQLHQEYDPLNPTQNKRSQDKKQGPKLTDQYIRKKRKSYLEQNEKEKSQKQDQKKDVVYIKNIPDYYNTVELLTTFYKKFGQIENISVDKQKHQARVQFMKELDAVKAVNSNKKLFNKQDIIVSLNMDFSQPENQPTVEKNPQENLKNSEEKHQEKVETELKERQQTQKVNPVFKAKIQKSLEIKTKRENLELKNQVLSKIANKIKIILYLKNREEREELKQELTQSLQHFKTKREQISKGKFELHLREIAEKENQDNSFDLTLIFTQIEEHLLSYKEFSKLFEGIAKIENLKIFAKDRKALIKFPNFEQTEKVFNKLSQFQVSFLDPNLMKFIKTGHCKDEKSHSQETLLQNKVDSDNVKENSKNNAGEQSLQ